MTDATLLYVVWALVLGNLLPRSTVYRTLSCPKRDRIDYPL